MSVLIGCWNAAATLRRAIDSILAQTLADLELVVVDDGSTDETPELVAAVDDPRVRHLRLPHMGIARSLNRGIEAARAPIVAIQDADDWSLPHRLERQVSVLDSHPQVAVVGCRMQEIDEHGRRLRARTAFVAGDVRRALMWVNPIPNTSVAFRRDVVRALGGYDPRYRYSMDHDLWLRVADRHGVMTVDEVLAIRVMSSTNFGTSKERAQMLDSLRAQTAAMRRRRSLRGAPGVALPALSIATPLPVKRAVRRALGQAP